MLFRHTPANSAVVVTGGLWTAFTAHRPRYSGCLGSGPKHLIHNLNFVPNRKKREKMSLCHAQHHMWITFLKKRYLDRICNMRVGLYFLFLFTYITYALIFFILKMKDARKHRSYCLLVLFWYWGGLKNNQSGIFWYSFKIIIEVFQHFTLSNFLSCGNDLFLSFSCHLMYWYKSDLVTFF